MTEPVLLHIVDRAAWAEAEGSGSPYEPDDLAEVGFVHLSTPDLVEIPANQFYAGRGDLLLLVLDAAELGDAVRFEAGVPPSGDLLFPHLYGPIPRSAVRRVVPFPPGADGRFRRPDLGGS